MNSPSACHVAGITYRQLDYWARTGLACPNVPAAGSGVVRDYSVEDVIRLTVISELLDLGLSLPVIREYIDEINSSASHYSYRITTRFSTVIVNLAAIREHVTDRVKELAPLHAVQEAS